MAIPYFPSILLFFVLDASRFMYPACNLTRALRTGFVTVFPCLRLRRSSVRVRSQTSHAMMLTHMMPSFRTTRGASIFCAAITKQDLARAARHLRGNVIRSKISPGSFEPDLGIRFHQSLFCFWTRRLASGDIQGSYLIFLVVNLDLFILQTLYLA